MFPSSLYGFLVWWLISAVVLWKATQIAHIPKVSFSRTLVVSLAQRLSLWLLWLILDPLLPRLPPLAWPFVLLAVVLSQVYLFKIGLDTTWGKAGSALFYYTLLMFIIALLYGIIFPHHRPWKWTRT
ncbi:MAG TPA: hypothetical protein EYP85_00695 [Armatimonadetes bacterium]|nr:hypothetical protein [Armatimonadota bacterium]